MSCAVLVVEDEVTLAKNILLFLERHGYQVRTAQSAEQALGELESFRPEAVILDFNLPGMDGLQFLRQLLRVDPQIKIIMTTGHGSEQIAVDAMKAGAYDYFTKPLSLEKLTLVLDKAVADKKRDNMLSYYHNREAGDSGLAKLIGSSPEMRAVKDLIQQLLATETVLADSQSPAVLITGETGTGKELVARALHFDGARRKKPFVEVNCSCIPAQLLEAELFGYERGAFTDARERKLGLIESAEGGTLFLDEIGDMGVGLQGKLLRFLEDKTVRRLGSVRDQKANGRIVVATNRELEQLVSEGKFRSDLFYRLHTIHIQLPPLRARHGDILVLAWHFLQMHALRYGKRNLKFTDSAVALLESHSWSGNVRELINLIEQSVILARGEWIEPAQLILSKPIFASGKAEPIGAVEPGGTPAQEAISLDEVERQTLLKALEQTSWNVTKAAKLLNVSRDTMRYRINKFQLKSPP
jgi:DNA-binding NtrC family response regulator